MTQLAQQIALLPAAFNRGVGEAPFGEDEFVRVENVPVFAEHSTTRPDGSPLQFGARELQQIAERCNRRITETGDYAAVCIGHTPKPEARAAGAQMPPLIGFAGPFRLGVLGQGVSQRHVILADMWIRRDEMDAFRRHPRRSPELWLEADYADMILDPIALLGAEPPRLDMGLVYSRAMAADGREVLKYSSLAAEPGAANVFVPSDRQRNSAGPNPEASDMDATTLIPQIVQAISSLPEFQFIRSLMDQQSGDPVGGGMPTPPAEEPPAAPPVAPPAAPAAAAPADPPTPPAAGGADEPPAPPEDDDPAKYAALDAMGDDELEQYMARRKRRYEAGSLEQNESGSTASTGTLDQSPEQYSRGHAGATHYAAEAQRLRNEMAALRADLNKQRAVATDSTRRAKLAQLQNDGVILDLDEEMHRACYSRMNDDQFAGHVDAITKHYQRVPLGGLPPGLGGELSEGSWSQETPGAGRQRASAEDAQRAKYAKEATQIVLRGKQRGQDLDFAVVLNDLHAGKSSQYAAL